MAITNVFVVPPTPVSAKKQYVYPWEHTEFANICQQLYSLASTTGYMGTLEDFKRGFGAYLEANNILTTDDFKKYMGQYEVTPLPLVEQILNTKNKVLENNIVIQPIPYHQVDNDAGGRTVTIG